MKKYSIIVLLLLAFISSKAQTKLPEFNDKPAYFNTSTNELIELEKSQYNTMAKAKGLFSAEGGFYLNGTKSSVKIANKNPLKFIVKVNPGTDPTSVFDLVKFEVRKDKRVLVTTKAKATSTSTSYEKISYTLEKIKDGYYYLVAKNLAPGEYFFGSNDFMFAFSLE